MIVPSAMFIYSAQDRLKEGDREFQQAELAELREADIKVPSPGPQSEREYFYLLGLEVARTILSASPALVEAGLKPGEIL